MKNQRAYHKHLWGSEEWLTNNELYCDKYLILREGFMSSLHYHIIKDETFIIIKGSVLLEVGTKAHEKVKGYKNITMKVGDIYRLNPYTVHRFKSLTKNSIILEVSTHHEDEDSIKIIKAQKL